MDPLVVTTIEKEATDAPVLIIDRQGSIGYAISQKIKKELLTAFVSEVAPATTENLIHIPYKHRFPEIPNEQYAMILFVYDKEKNIYDLLKKCMEKAREDAIPCIFIVADKEADELLITKLLEAYEENYVIILGELFGQGNSLVDSYLLQAGISKTIQLPSMGLREIHPVLFDDCIYGILQTIFGIQRRHRVTFLYSEHVYTDLSIVHSLQKIDPLLHIDFLKEKKKKQHNKKKLSIKGFYFFDKEYAVSEKIVAVYRAVSSKRNTLEDGYVYKEETISSVSLGSEMNGFEFPEPIRKWGGVVLYSLFIALSIPLVSFLVSGGITTLSMTNAKKNLEKGNFMQVKQQIVMIHNTFLFDELIKSTLFFELNSIGLSGLSRQLDKKISIGKELTSSLLDLFVAQETFTQVITGKLSNPEQGIASFVSTVRSSLVTLQKITTDDPDEKALLAMVGKYQKGVDLISGVVGVLPHVLAPMGKRTYLVLFQNNMELRPGGGFIGSYGLATFDHGNLQDVAIHNVYDADGQLQQHVDPPFAIRRFMGNVHLYLRDSNFDPDFSINAQKTADMLQLESRQHVDGVMAIDLTFIKYLLAMTGPITIPQQNITINENNFFLLTEEHAEKKSFPGSTQKEDFLNSVFLAIQNKLQSQSHIKFNAVVEKSLQAIQEKHILFALADSTDQNILTTNHLSSSLWDSRPQTMGTVADYMGISEANIGVNKVNYFIKRSLKQSVSIDGDGTLKGKVQIAYQNTSKLNEWPGGDYKNYLRIMVPKDTSLTNISFDGQTQATRSAILDPLIYEAKGFVPPSELEIEQTQEQGKTIYGFLVTIPATTVKTVTISYEHNQKINLGNPVLHYSLMLYKQPGTNNDPLSFSFNFPLEYSILSASPANGDGNNDYTVDTQLSEDKTIRVDLTKK